MLKTYLMAFIMGIVCAIPIHAQDTAPKIEVEKSIHREDAPGQILHLLEAKWAGFDNAHYYRQSNGQSILFEIKFEWRDHQYSLEFNDAGQLLEIEQLIDLDDINAAPRSAIMQHIQKQFSKFELTRIQRQFTSAEQDEEAEEIIEDFLEQNREDLIIRYEIELNGQNKKELGPFEFLFDRQGSLIQKRRIQKRSIDTIW
jgi:hypothetical protein